ncbi:MULTISPECIES: hypothetical protein [Bacillaceae]|uniref:DUF2939 domain-containing protein n=1 Tax=Evansella alkalicola TaxID=745819 RepID=A0ABS6JS43_9BACI|nr:MULTISPECIES: hypothetical protein [Bacillaceae]MBU9721308.1 hypothetical protein [Bacillus alkalicola]
MKNNYIGFGVIVLLVIVTFFIFREPSQESIQLEELQQQMDYLINENGRLEDALTESSALVNELQKENKEQADVIADLNDTPLMIDYRVFSDAIETVESYKQAEDFEEAMKYFSSNVGMAQFEEEHNVIVFNDNLIDWRPNAIEELREFTIADDQLILTYSADRGIRHWYGFVMVKEDEWKIDEIKLQ